MSDEKKFYVYVHRRATDGTIFYVGKGSRKRLTDAKFRNAHWHHIANKHGWTAEIICRFDNEVCAFSFEKSFIMFIGRQNLCNMTDGGEGMSGHKPTPETLAHLSRVRTGKTLTDAHRKNISLGGKGLSKPNSFKEKISQAKSGGKHHFWGISGADNPTTHREKYTFLHNELGKEFLTKQEFYTKYTLNRSKVSALVNGSRKLHKGWSYAPI